MEGGQPPQLLKTETDDNMSVTSSVAESEGGKNTSGKVKSTCEQCSSAKVKCSGVVPCERCTKRGLKCEYAMEKKRGRRTTTKKKESMCSDNSCWGQVILNPISKCEDFGGKFGLDSVERRIFQVFFAMYKHHATPQSCCREWFTWQLNKMSCFLAAHGKPEGAARLDDWMRLKGIMVLSKDPEEYKKIPMSHIEEGTGRILPPVLAQKGPKFTVSDEIPMKRGIGQVTGNVYSTGGMHRPNMRNDPVDRCIAQIQNSCFLYIRSTHECFEVEVNQAFTELFGYTTDSFKDILEQLFGGLLPWGSDLVAALMHRDNDLLFFIRTTALKFNQVGRPQSFPATRQVVSSHIFELMNRARDIIECMVSSVHREFLTVDRTEVEIFMGFEPTIPDVPRLYQGYASPYKNRILSSSSGIPLPPQSTYDTLRSQPAERSAATRHFSDIGQNPVPPCEENPGSNYPAANPNVSFLSNTQRGRLAFASSYAPPPELSNTSTTADDESFFLDNILDWADEEDQFPHPLNFN